MLCILYVNTVGALLGFVGLLVERALPSASSRRWIWCVIIPLSIFLPGFYRANHTASVTDLFPQGAPSSPAGKPLAPGFWARLQAYDPLINDAWQISSAMLLLWGLATVFHVFLVVRGGRARWLSDVDGVPVIVTDTLGPATVGFWKSRVVVPRWVLTLPRPERAYIMHHEDEHRRSHDAQLLFLASLPLLLLPWSAALWWQLHRLRLAVEMDCDKRVVSKLGDPNRYGELLLKIAQSAGSGQRLQPALLGGAGMLERRLVALVDPRPLRRAQRFLVPAIAVALGALVLLMPHPVAGPDAAEHATHTGKASAVIIPRR